VDLSLARNDNERLALALFRAMEEGNFIERLPDLVTEDFAWSNSGLPTLAGRQAVIAHARAGGFARAIPILATMTSFSADVLNIASNGNVVFTERIDHHWDARGWDLMTPHIAGVVEIRDGKACALRDFYDTSCYRQSPVPPTG